MMSTPAGGGYLEDQPVASDEIVAAVGKASEALECVERARGYLYSFHQLTGHADILFAEAAQMLEAAGAADAGGSIATEVVGRNVLDGRWSFQVIEEYDALFFEPVRDAVRGLELEFQNGRRHVFEARMKEAGRSRGVPGHEHRPADAHSSEIETDSSA